jgi:hypothetical protein
LANPKSGGWVKGCVVGCGGLVVFVVLVLVAGTMSIMRPMNQAIDAREALENRIGAATAFTPQSDGSVAPDRVEAFISVREAVIGPCTGIEGRFSSLLRMEDFDDVEDPPRLEILRAGLSASGAALGLPRQIGRLHLLRNRALLEADMSFGEYVYIYLTAYHQRFGDVPDHARLFEGSPITSTLPEELVSMLSRQAEALRSQGGPMLELEALGMEIAEMQGDPDRLPWADGLPEPVADSYDSFRHRLDELFCPAAVGIELLRNSRHGLSIKAE